MANVLIKLFILFGTIVFVTGTALSHLNTTTNGFTSSSQRFQETHLQERSTNQNSKAHSKINNNNHHHSHHNGHTHNFTWSEWSEWSPCSRPCDGGISISLRKCLSRSVCIGDAHRYRICNMHDCSHPTDYRALQCASFNSRAFRDRFYEWEPYIDPVDPCSLTCKAKGVSFVAKLAPIVKDGTRCRDSSLDMCVAGKCLSVGCDLQLGSLAHLDDCGVCGGDGSSCSSSFSSSSLFSWTHRFLEPCSSSCGGGQQESEVVCANTETGTFVSPNECNKLEKPSPTRRPCNTHRCPPTWRVDEWSQCSKKCGGGRRTRTVECYLHLNGTHRILSDSSCSENVKPESEQTCNDFDCPQWFTGSWEKCSQTCGKGVQRRVVNCRDSTTFESSQCEEELKPADVQECSDFSDCPSDEEDLPADAYSSEPNYSVGEWSPCNVSCGQGFQIRNVQCRIYLAFSKSYRNIPDEQCPGVTPEREKKCQIECPLFPHDEDNEIYDENYRKLEKSISAMMKKTFDSDDEEYISESDDSAPLNGDALYRWEASGFTECSQLCLGGVQETKFICLRISDNSTVDSSFCNIDEKPDSYTRTCNDHPCPPKWEISEYSSCSKQCGRGGVRTRQVRCVHEVARGNGNIVQVDESKCQDDKPQTKEFCNQIDCPARWIAGAWTKCSKECGRGIKSRKIRCMRETAFDGMKESSPRDCPVRKPRLIKNCNLKSCKFGENVIPTYHLSESDGSRKAKRNNNALWVNKYTQEKVIIKVEGKAIIYEGSLVKLRCPDWKESMDYDLKFDTKLRWSKNNVPIGADENHYLIRNVLKLKSVKLNDTGVYKCQLEDETVHSMFLHIIQKPVNDPVPVNDESLSPAKDKTSSKFESNSLFDLETSASTERKLTLDEGNFQNLKFNWITTQWSDCTVNCGGIGFRMRLAQCYVQFENITEKVQNQFCVDAGMKQPKNIETCGFKPCARWQASPWSECTECESYNRAKQTRDINCVTGNGVVEPDDKCNAIDKPELSRDCYNPRCIPHWKVSEWSQCNSFGEKTRTVTCVWKATGMPVTTMNSSASTDGNQISQTISASSNSLNKEQDIQIGNQCDLNEMPTILERCMKTSLETSSRISSQEEEEKDVPTINDHLNQNQNYHHQDERSFHFTSNEHNRKSFNLLDSSLV